MNKFASLGTLATNYSILMMGAINGVLLARWLGPDDRGAVAAALLWPVMLVGLTHQGLVQAIVYYSAKPATSKGSIFGISLVNSGMLSMIVVPIGFTIMPWLLASQTTETIQLSRLYLIIVPLLMVTESNVGLLQGAKHFSAVNVLRICTPVGYLAGTLVLFALGELDVRNIVLLQLVLGVVRLLISLHLMHRAALLTLRKGSAELFKDIWQYGAKAHLGSISNLASGRLDQALMTALVPPGVLGLYVAAVNASQILLALANSVRTLMVPSIASAPSVAVAKPIFSRIFSMYWVASLLGALALSPVLYWGIPLLYGEAYRDAVWITQALLVATIVLGAKVVWIAAARAFGQPWIGSRAELVGMIVTVVLLPLLLPLLGVWGAVIVSVLAYAITLYVVVLGLGDILGESGWKLFQPSWKSLKAGVQMYLIPARYGAVQK